MPAPSGSTATLALPYPLGTDDVDVPRDMKALGDKLDANMRFRLTGTYETRPAANTLPEGTRWLDTGRLMEWQIISGAWVLIRAQPMVVAQASQNGSVLFPSSPIDGQIVEFMLDKQSTNFASWRFRYRTGASMFDGNPIRDWEFIGGNPLIHQVLTSETQPFAAATGDISGGTVGPQIVIPLSCSYEIRFGCSYLCNGKNSVVGSAYAYLNIGGTIQTGTEVGGTELSKESAAIGSSGSIGKSGLSQTYRSTNIVAGTVVKMVYASSAGASGATATYYNRFLHILPTYN